MALLDEEIAAALAALGVDVATLVRAYGLGAASPCATPARWQPAVDVYESGRSVVIKLELAGVDVQDVTLTLRARRPEGSGCLVVISGERRDEAEGPRSAVGHMEIDYGPFEKRIWIPWAVKATGVRARYDRGFLLIILQEAPRPVRRAVSIRVCV